MNYHGIPTHRPSLAKIATMRNFIAGLHHERAWLKEHPNAKEYARSLTDDECKTLEVFSGSSVMGRRDARGGIAWCIAAVEPSRAPHANN